MSTCWTTGHTTVAFVRLLPCYWSLVEQLAAVPGFISCCQPWKFLFSTLIRRLTSLRQCNKTRFRLQDMPVKCGHFLSGWSGDIKVGHDFRKLTTSAVYGVDLTFRSLSLIRGFCIGLLLINLLLNKTCWIIWRWFSLLPPSFSFTHIEHQDNRLWSSKKKPAAAGSVCEWNFWTEVKPLLLLLFQLSDFSRGPWALGWHGPTKAHPSCCANVHAIFKPWLTQESPCCVLMRTTSEFELSTWTDETILQGGDEGIFLSRNTKPSCQVLLKCFCTTDAFHNRIRNDSFEPVHSVRASCSMHCFFLWFDWISCATPINFLKHHLCSSPRRIACLTFRAYFKN